MFLTPLTHTYTKHKINFMTEKKTRVRFAPSPTGPLHMGGVRTALYNYLYAKQRCGVFVLRIEDTDSQRFVPGAEEYIIDSLKWCGITPDEGLDENGKIASSPSEKNPYAPYRQSERKHLYKKYAEELVDKGFAYYAFDSSEELDAKRKEAEANKQTFIYNYLSRKELKNSLTLPKEECDKLLANTTNWTIRFKIPENQTVKMNDLIRGEIEVETNTLDDKVLWKRADELPTYHLANIVDDHLMDITEVIRGAEWLPSLPLHYLLYRALGWEDTMPKFAHLSLLLKPDGKGKLSKRDGDRLGFPVFPLKWENPENGEISRGYREDGYYPEAFVNLLALLGWNPGTEQEIFSLKELIDSFSLERVIKSGAKFNPDKAKWFNQQYLRGKSGEELALEFRKDIDIKLPHNSISNRYLSEICELIKERAHFSYEFWDISKSLFVAPDQYDSNDVAKFCKEDMKPIIEEVLALIKESPMQTFKDYDQSQISNNQIDYKSLCCEKIEEILMHRIRERGWKTGNVMNLLRLYFTGNTRGLGISDIIYFIGKEESIGRIEKGINSTFAS